MANTSNDANSGYTPGPWMAAAAISSIVGLPVVARSGQAIASVHSLPKKPDGISNADWEAYGSRCLANARLIAAAPDLLAALREAVDFHDDEDNEIIARWRAVISRAEGRG